MNDEFSNSLVSAATNAMVEAESQRATAEIQAEYIIAKRFPRDEKRAIDRILNACTREKLAESAIYSYARGGTAISGPSIRLAEAVAQAWGNIKFGIRELDQRDGISTVQAFAKDLETGTSREMVFQVAHKRFTRQGTKDLVDPRDIYELVANNGARRLRACILAIVPGDVVEMAVNQCEATLNTTAEVTDETIKTMLEKFSEFGVSKAQIEKKIQRNITALTPAQLVDLRSIYNSLRDGMSSAFDWFDKVEEIEVSAPKFEANDEPPKRGRKPKKDDAQDSHEQSEYDKLKSKMEEMKITEEDVIGYIEELHGEKHQTVKAMGEQIHKGLQDYLREVITWKESIKSKEAI